MLKTYLRIALRNIRRHKTYSSINILGLSLGMLCCLMIMLWVQNELSYNQFHKNKADLYRVVSLHNSEFWVTYSPWALAPTLKNDFPEIKSFSRFRSDEVVVTYGEKKFYEPSAMVDPDFLKMFSFQLIKGNIEDVLDRKESVVISKKIASKYFGNEDPVGKTLVVNNRMNLTITGILDDIPSNSSLQFEVLIPIANLGERTLSGWSIESESFVQLNTNTNIQQIREKIAGTTVKYDRRVENKDIINDLEPIERIHLYSLNDTGPILYVYIFSLVALIVLIVACINFINLVTAKASLRSREIGVRKVIGAEKKQLIIQFLSETFLLSFIAIFIAYILGTILLPSFNELTGRSLSIDLFNQPSILLFLFGLILLTTLIAGSYPAFMLSSLKPIKMLKDSKISGSNSSIRWTLVVMQFSVSIILIILTIAMNDQMSYIQNKNLGINKEQVLIVPLDRDINNKFEAVKNELLNNRNITHVTRATSLPTNLNFGNPVYWEGKTHLNYTNMNYVTVDYDYLETFDIKMVEGRSFSKEYSTDPENYIVNEAAIKLMDLDSPLGKMFSIWQNEGKIIGVVKDFHSTSLHNEIRPVVFTMRTFVPMNHIFIKISPTNIKESIASIEKIWAEQNSSVPFQYKFLDDLFNKQYQNEQKIEALFQYLSLLAIVISCMGLFGLAAFTAETKTKEIGIRKVIGASITSIIVMMLKDFTKWLAVAICIASPLAYLMISKWLDNFAYHIEISFGLFLLSNLIVLTIAIGTVGWQSIKVASANPVESLRSE